MTTKPPDALGILNGLYYKIGRLGKMYYWNDEEWIISDKDPATIEQDIKTYKELKQ